MQIITLHLDGEDAWTDLADHMQDVIHLADDAPPIQIATLDHGMTSGRPSIAIRLDLPDGRVVVAETSVRLFLETAKLIEARWGTHVWMTDANQAT